MIATRSDVDEWIRIAKNKGDRYIISMRDTYDEEDYPIYVGIDVEIKKEIEFRLKQPMQEINEIISIDPVSGIVKENLSPKKI